MKKESREKIKRENGWDEVRTKHIRFNGFKVRHFLKCRVWQQSKRDHTSKQCNYCRAKWDNKDPDEWTCLVQTPHGNKVLCTDCFDNVFDLTPTHKGNKE